MGFYKLGGMIVACSAICLAARVDDPAEFFEAKVRPVLVKNCYACHTTSKLGGLRLDSRAGLLKGGNDGPAISPGDPEKSLLIQAVRHTHARFKMPPQNRLAAEEIAALEQWVKAGAVWPEQAKGTAEPAAKFWSFQPVRKPAVPAVKNTAWPSNDIDRFILSQLEQRGLKPVRPVDKRTLIRRATFDLTGLPPTAEEVAAFEKDTSPDSFAKVVDRLLASPRYGERWARYWLDIARYSDDVMFGAAPNFYLYRDWVIQALNQDMPYDLFVKAQLAADQIPGVNNQELLPALTLFVDAPSEFTDDDRVDVLTRGFLGLTVACAKCHDHKYDPIPTKDYYALLGVFRNTEYREVPLAPAPVVEAYKEHKKNVDEQEAALKSFLRTESEQVVEVLAGNTSCYLMAAWRVMAQRQPLAAAARQDSLDQETLDRWVTYLHAPAKQHPYLKDWEGLLSRHAAEAEMRKASDAFQELAVETLRQKRAVDEYNRAISYGAKTQRMLGDVVGRTMDRAHYMLWQELAAEGNPHANDAVPDARVDGVLYYKGEKVERFLPPSYREHLAQMRTRLGQLKAAMPPQYPYLSIIQDVPKPENLHVFIRGNAQNPGEEAPRAFLTALRDCAPQPFTRGSGRLELAEAIANPHNPLTARVMVNRVWQYHFGYGIVRTPSNFGLTGDRPSNAPLLDYLASRLVENRWSLKALHREILLSSTYALSADRAPENTTADPDNRLNWRYNRQRLDAEALRDALLFVAGDLDPKAGGPPVPLEDSKNHRRTVYGRISRQRINPMLAMFDFPNPNITSEQRVPTTVPLQRLFLLNSGLMMQQADALAARIAREAGDGPEARIRHAYHLLFQRSPKPREIAAALDFLQTGAAAWPEYAQVLLSSNEFLYVD